MARLQLSQFVEISDKVADANHWQRLHKISPNAITYNRSANLSNASISHREKSIIIIEPDSDYIDIMLKFLENVFENERHHQTRIESMRFLNIILKTWPITYCKRYGELICNSILVKLITDRRVNLNSLCIPALILLFKRV